MNAQEHYREAERLLRAAAYDTKDSALEERDAERDADFLLAAQVHATLALAAMQGADRSTGAPNQGQGIR